MLHSFNRYQRLRQNICCLYLTQTNNLAWIQLDSSSELLINTATRKIRPFSWTKTLQFKKTETLLCAAEGTAMHQSALVRSIHCVWQTWGYAEKWQSCAEPVSLKLADTLPPSNCTTDFYLVLRGSPANCKRSSWSYNNSFAISWS